eukprot:3598789-Pleurochrysis_carterae.AAC.2
MFLCTPQKQEGLAADLLHMKIPCLAAIANKATASLLPLASIAVSHSLSPFGFTKAVNAQLYCL